ncbi:MAG: hypothetical protein ABJA10_04445 [Aestuariivirga sp.]
MMVWIFGLLLNLLVGIAAEGGELQTQVGRWNVTQSSIYCNKVLWSIRADPLDIENEAGLVWHGIAGDKVVDATENGNWKKGSVCGHLCHRLINCFHGSGEAYLLRQLLIGKVSVSEVNRVWPMANDFTLSVLFVGTDAVSPIDRKNRVDPHVGGWRFSDILERKFDGYVHSVSIVVKWPYNFSFRVFNPRSLAGTYFFKLPLHNSLLTFDCGTLASAIVSNGNGEPSNDDCGNSGHQPVVIFQPINAEFEFASYPPNKRQEFWWIFPWVGVFFGFSLMLFGLGVVVSERGLRIFWGLSVMGLGFVLVGHSLWFLTR